jgi:anti-sigma-K factor RskA
MVESRGRTGRRPTAEEKSGPVRGGSKRPDEAKPNRLDQPPTWRSAVLRSMAAAVVMLLLAIVLTKKPNEAVAIFPVVLVLYIPISYYTDLWLYKRRQRQKLARAAAEKAARAAEKASAE